MVRRGATLRRGGVGSVLFMMGYMASVALLMGIALVVIWLLDKFDAW